MYAFPAKLGVPGSSDRTLPWLGIHLTALLAKHILTAI